MKKRMISILAQSRIRYNKNRTILTVIAIAFTTMLLMALGTCSVGLMDTQRQIAVSAGNQHAAFSDLTKTQFNQLKNHMDVEAIDTQEIFATIEYGKMNGYLIYRSAQKEGITSAVGNLIEGRKALSADDICGSKAFFERLGVEPVIGSPVTISFRPNGDGAIETRTFTICGIVSETDLSKLNISDSRIAYSAYISEELLKEYISEENRLYRAAFRINGEDRLNYDEMKERIRALAEDIGYDPEKIDYNSQYLLTVTDPGTEMAGIVCGMGTMVIIFSSLVIYSIYYVGIITDIQELGKLKALGASNAQLKQLLLREGLSVTLIALPIGLIAGYLIPRFLFPVFVKKIVESTVYVRELETIHMFSLPVTLIVILAVLITVYLSLLKPMRMAARISPIEAIRYQESRADRKNRRKGYDTVNVSRLCAANLIRNRKRTLVTMITMGLSCILFMSLAGLMNSMSPEDLARRAVSTGDFHIQLDYALDDKVYPENNLDSLQQENYFDAKLFDRIRGIDGVTDIQSKQTVLAGSDFESELFADGCRTSLSPMSREEAKKYTKEVKKGSIDYDQMISKSEVLFTSDYFMEEYGISIGDTISMTVFDGKEQLPLTVRIAASMDSGEEAQFLLPQEIWDKLKLSCDATTDLYIAVEEDAYGAAKEALGQLVDENPHFRLYSIDEERSIGAMSVGLIKYPLYAILIIIAVIGFINLINTMITSIVTRKRELGILQAIGLSDRQLVKMLAGEGAFFIAGTLFISVTLGNLLGYLIFLWGRRTHFMSVSVYHYPVRETIGLLSVLLLGQLFITLFISRRIRRESPVDRIRSNE